MLIDEAARLEELAAEREAARSNGFDLTLIGRRSLRSNNSWMHNSRRLMKGADRCTAMLHPDDAERRGLSDGQRVKVASSVGAIELPLELSDEMRQGVVSIPHGFGHKRAGVGWRVAAEHGGASVNDVTDPTIVDRLTGNAAFNDVPVRIEAVAERVGCRGRARRRRSLRPPRGSPLRLILNIIWFVLCGLWMALGYLVAALICFILIITIPFGIAALRIGRFALWPFGKTVVERRDAGAASLIGNVLWILLCGWWLALGHLVTGVLLCLTIIGIPLGLANFKLIPVSLMPFGREIVSVDDAHARGLTANVEID